MKNYPKVAVVILNWNGRFFLEKFLPSVYNSSYPNIEFVIGDNASTDDSLSFVSASYPKITILENTENYGFAGGYNHILSRVEADYFVLLNSDVEVTPNWIEPVIEMLERDRHLVAAQPKILAFHNKAKFEHAGAAGGYLDRYGFPFCCGRIMDKVEYDLGQYDDEKEIFWASGASLFIKSWAWKEAQGLDEDFFAHMEEIDLCWRLKKMGYRIGYCPDSTVYHVGGGTLNASNPQKTYLNFRNNLFMLQKNLPIGQLFTVIFIRFWFDFAALLKFILDRKFKDAWAVSRAHQAFFLHIFKNAKKRKNHIPTENKTGQYKKSIITDFYLDKKQKFSDLDQENFF
ncbi:glycosyltransferase family 2 protein [Sphingobacterium sp. UDSM-2020]|uniref:glycosyltransferase family 2 protein n=1 Tax=Sphingobacterium sp. UDSM-2020 TaxID=2795738 RepID=UPI0019367126|nr:glycosyltransferase family 2 protein [Sphingobacterium sp. UDSM-2020]QQD13777.1 glycosyltransferase family 2 protein [Sphingobacterium sp. UDSM-2020]